MQSAARLRTTRSVPPPPCRGHRREAPVAALERAAVLTLPLWAVGPALWPRISARTRLSAWWCFPRFAARERAGPQLRPPRGTTTHALLPHQDVDALAHLGSFATDGAAPTPLHVRAPRHRPRPAATPPLPPLTPHSSSSGRCARPPARRWPWAPARPRPRSPPLSRPSPRPAAAPSASWWLPVRGVPRDSTPPLCAPR